MFFLASIVPTHHPRKVSNNDLDLLTNKFRNLRAKYRNMELPAPQIKKLP